MVTETLARYSTESRLTRLKSTSSILASGFFMLATFSATKFLALSNNCDILVEEIEIFREIVRPSPVWLCDLSWGFLYGRSRRQWVVTTFRFFTRIYYSNQLAVTPHTHINYDVTRDTFFRVLRSTIWIFSIFFSLINRIWARIMT